MARILVVDDDLTILDLLAAMLERARHMVWRAGNAHDALAALNGPGPIDLAIIDLLLRDSTGLELIKQVRASQPTLPIVVISGYIGADSTELRASLAALGVKFALGKPLQQRALLDAVEQSIGK